MIGNRGYRQNGSSFGFTLLEVRHGAPDSGSKCPLGYRPVDEYRRTLLVSPGFNCEPGKIESIFFCQPLDFVIGGKCEWRCISADRLLGERIRAAKPDDGHVNHFVLWLLTSL